METTTKKLLGSVTISEEIIGEVGKSVNSVPSYKKKIEEYMGQSVSELLDVALFGAITLNASDIHLEPQEKDVRLRIRLDGILQDVIFFDHKTYHSLVSRLKLLSRIKLNITDRPQDGRFTIEMPEALIEIRSSCLPAEYGESIVMRILNPKSLIGIGELGLRDDLYKIFEKEILKPNGMIIVTGPTGSGKTTTLYAFLKKIQNPEIKIITIEDPIEYHLKGISQTQVAPEKGYDFSDGLRSIVRQDPDVILVGEIRDLETARISLQAALTGHLVLSTLHTNDAPGSIPRLVDLGADSSSIAPALKMVVAQRLVRKVCKNCSAFKKPTLEEFSEIKKALKNISRSVKLPDLEKIKVPRANEKGCEFCNFTGYRGRKGVFEAFLVDFEMERFILENPPVSSIKELAMKKGMVTIYQSGIIDIVLGNTTFEEVKRIVEADARLEKDEKADQTEKKELFSEN
ncbi:MAG: type II/IV secretion system protein [Candidatus Staskawiczbacteria bacterium]|nr:type II/IV secretion system protein [Candidatus Staskawiczbacteria bacterium]